MPAVDSNRSAISKSQRPIYDHMAGRTDHTYSVIVETVSSEGPMEAFYAALDSRYVKSDPKTHRASRYHRVILWVFGSLATFYHGAEASHFLVATHILRRLHNTYAQCLLWWFSNQTNT